MVRFRAPLPNIMTTIEYTIDNTKGEIVWSASEFFDELRGSTFDLGKMEAVEIEKLDNLSTRAKILLSAVAGAIIQHLLDQGYAAKTIFKDGKFSII